MNCREKFGTEGLYEAAVLDRVQGGSNGNSGADRGDEGLPAVTQTITIIKPDDFSGGMFLMGRHSFTAAFIGGNGGHVAEEIVCDLLRQN